MSSWLLVSTWLNIKWAKGENIAEFQPQGYRAGSGKLDVSLRINFFKISKWDRKSLYILVCNRIYNSWTEYILFVLSGRSLNAYVWYMLYYCVVCMWFFFYFLCWDSNSKCHVLKSEQGVFRRWVSHECGAVMNAISVLWINLISESSFSCS